METLTFTINEYGIEKLFTINIGEFEFDLEIQHTTDTKWIINLNNFGDDTYYYIVYLTNLIRFNSVNELKCNVDEDIINKVNELKPDDV